MQDQSNNLELRVIGMSRSGNHAIIRWLLAMAKGPTVFLNCCEGKTNPFDSARPTSTGSSELFEPGPMQTPAQPLPVPPHRDLLIHSYEDCFLGHGCSDEFEAHHDEWVGRSCRRHDILILRDPFNLFASRLRGFGERTIGHTARRVWKQHARQFDSTSTRLRHHPVLIRFNRWAEDERYRREIAQQLGLRFNDAGRWRMSKEATGASSFDGHRFHREPHRMRLHERWRTYREEHAFLAAFDQQMVEMALRIFPLSDELREWLERREKKAPQ